MRRIFLNWCLPACEATIHFYMYVHMLTGEKETSGQGDHIQKWHIWKYSDNKFIHGADGVLKTLCNRQLCTDVSIFWSLQRIIYCKCKYQFLSCTHLDFMFCENLHCDSQPADEFCASSALYSWQHSSKFERGTAKVITWMHTTCREIGNSNTVWETIMTKLMPYKYRYIPVYSILFWVVSWEIPVPWIM